MKCIDSLPSDEEWVALIELSRECGITIATLRARANRMGIELVKARDPSKSKQRRMYIRRRDVEKISYSERSHIEGYLSLEELAEIAECPLMIIRKAVLDGYKDKMKRFGRYSYVPDDERLINAIIKDANRIKNDHPLAKGYVPVSQVARSHGIYGENIQNFTREMVEIAKLLGDDVVVRHSRKKVWYIKEEAVDAVLAMMKIDRYKAQSYEGDINELFSHNPSLRNSYTGLMNYGLTEGDTRRIIGKKAESQNIRTINELWHMVNELEEINTGYGHRFLHVLKNLPDGVIAGYAWASMINRMRIVLNFDEEKAGDMLNIMEDGIKRCRSYEDFIGYVCGFMAPEMEKI